MLFYGGPRRQERGFFYIVDEDDEMRISDGDGRPRHGRASGPDREVFPDLGAASDIAFFVGPEGGFTDAETGAMFEAGAIPLRIGDWTLRVETAAAAGLGVLNVLLNRN